jgi:Ca2+-binding EF-hand superfamily protein
MRFWGVHPTQDEINNIINEYDLDGDGHIDFSEYKEIYKAFLHCNLGEDRNRLSMIYAMLFAFSIKIARGS